MKKIILYVLLFSFILLTISCGPKHIVPTKIPELDFSKTDYVSVDLDSIIKPDAPVHIWMDKDFKKVPSSQAKYLILTKKEYAKYVAQLKIKKTYKQIIEQQVILANQQVDVINSLKEYLKLERLKATEYRNLWIDSENAYRQEAYDHKISNAINKGAFSIITIGTFVAALLIAL